MRFLICTLVFISFLSSTSYSKEKFNSDQVYKMINDNFESITKGLTPEQIEHLKSQLEAGRDELNRIEKLSPEEKKKLDEENKKLLSDPEANKKFKEGYSNLPEEDKELIEAMIKNIKVIIKNTDEKLKNAKPIPPKTLSRDLVQKKKLNIRTGTPDFLFLSDEKIARMGNKDVPKLKENFRAAVEKANQLNKFEVDQYCQYESDCMAISYGLKTYASQPQTGPAGFVIMSKEEPKSKVISELLNELTELDKEIQSSLKGFLYTGKAQDFPILVCYRNECSEKRD